jgi:transcriptional regulator with XRE-family HTH domain
MYQRAYPRRSTRGTTVKWRGISQASCPPRRAWEAGVSRSYMARIEGEQTSTGVDVIAKLCAVLKVEPAEMFKAPPRRGHRGG